VVGFFPIPNIRRRVLSGSQPGKVLVTTSNIVPPAQNLKAKQLFFLAGTKDCPLSFSDRLVWSFLVYRLGQAKGDAIKGAVRLNQIERGTGLDDRIIRTSLAELVKLGLAQWTERDTRAVQRYGKSHNRIDGKVVAIEGDSSQWLHRRKDVKSVTYPWWKSAVYFPISLPKKGTLTARQNALYWAIKFRPRQKQTYYAAWLGVSRRTVQQNVNDLRDLKLLVPDSLTVSRQPPDLWVSNVVKLKPTKKWKLSKTFSFTDEDNYSFYKSAADICEILDHRADQMVAAGYSTKDVFDIWHYAFDLLKSKCGTLCSLEHFIREFPGIFKVAESITRLNRDSGSFNGVNSAGLLRVEISKAVKQIQSCDASRLLLWSYCA
jgi:hypothetical protein